MTFAWKDKAVRAAGKRALQRLELTDSPLTGGCRSLCRACDSSSGPFCRRPSASSLVRPLLATIVACLLATTADRHKNRNPLFARRASASGGVRCITIGDSHFLPTSNKCICLIPYWWFPAQPSQTPLFVAADIAAVEIAR